MQVKHITKKKQFFLINLDEEDFKGVENKFNGSINLVYNNITANYYFEVPNDHYKKNQVSLKFYISETKNYITFLINKTKLILRLRFEICCL